MLVAVALLLLSIVRHYTTDTTAFCYCCCVPQVTLSMASLGTLAVSSAELASMTSLTCLST
jgi:hypothetical protein